MVLPLRHKNVDTHTWLCFGSRDLAIMKCLDGDKWVLDLSIVVGSLHDPAYRGGVVDLIYIAVSGDGERT